MTIPAHEDPCLFVRELTVRAISTATDERWVDVVASTADVDSYDEIVEQSWRLTRFLANPVVLWAHQSREPPLGFASNVAVNKTTGNLEMRLNFVDANANPKGPQTYQLFKQKALRGVSVGFMPGEVVKEMVDGVERVVLKNNDLYEISATPIPANPSAVARMRARMLETTTTRAASPRPEATMNQEQIAARAQALEQELDQLVDIGKIAGVEKGTARTFLATGNVQAFERHMRGLRDRHAGLFLHRDARGNTHGGSALAELCGGDGLAGYSAHPVAAAPIVAERGKGPTAGGDELSTLMFGEGNFETSEHHAQRCAEINHSAAKSVEFGGEALDELIGGV